MDIKDEIEQFIGWTHFDVSVREDIIHISGYYDDLNPEPKRSNLESKLAKLRRDFRSAEEDEFSFSIQKVYTVERNYSHIKLKVKFDR